MPKPEHPVGSLYLPLPIIQDLQRLAGGLGLRPDAALAFAIKQPLETLRRAHALPDLEDLKPYSPPTTKGDPHA